MGGHGECEEKGRLLNLIFDRLNIPYISTQKTVCLKNNPAVQCQRNTDKMYDSYMPLDAQRTIVIRIRSGTFCVAGFKENGAATVKDEH